MTVSGLPIACAQPRNTARCLLRVAVAMLQAMRTSGIENVRTRSALCALCTPPHTHTHRRHRLYATRAVNLIRS